MGRSKRWFKAAREFESIGEQDLMRLRNLPYNHLTELDEPVRRVIVAGRVGTLSTIVQPGHGGPVQIVLQGFLPVSRLPFLGKHVFVGGFRKGQDGSVTELAPEELYEYD